LLLQKSLELVDHEVIDGASLDEISHKGFNSVSLVNDNALKTEVSNIDVNVELGFTLIILLVIISTGNFLLRLCMIVILVVEVVVVDSGRLIVFTLIILLLLKVELRKITFVGSVHGLRVTFKGIKVAHGLLTIAS
jgi:hypothetical protein